MRTVFVFFALINWIQAVELTVNSNFTDPEDTALIFTYDQLLAKCTVSVVPSGFKISLIGTDGTLDVGNSAGGPWGVPALNSSLIPGQFVRFIPTANLNGAGVFMLAIRATSGGVDSTPARFVNVDIAAVNDVITAVSGSFVQPATKVTEDVQYGFTWQQILDTLQVVEPDPQDWTIRITGKLSGTLSTPGGTAITTFPTDLPIGLLSAVALRWTPDPYAFTKSTEPGLPVFSAMVQNVPLGDQTAVVTFSTPVVGVDTSLGVMTTLGSIDPLPVNLVTPIALSYDDVRNLMRNTNDYDRDGAINLWFSNPGMAGVIVRTFTWSGGVLIGYSDQNLPSLTPVNLGTGNSMTIIAPAGMAAGLHAAGTGTIDAGGTIGPASPQPFSITVASVVGGTSGSGASGGGGGGCGVGSTGLGILLAGILCLRARRRQPC